MLQLSGDSRSHSWSCHETVRSHPMRSMQTKPPVCPTVLVLLIVISGVRANEPREVRGRVVDEAGRPVADAAVGCFWRADGSARDRGGKPYDLTKQENVRLFWGHLGEMEPT